MEFQNIFNRTFYGAPGTIFLGTSAITNPTAPILKTNPFPNGQPGAYSGGFGYVATLNGFGATPRTGQLVARLQF
jgi:hypothetical protein